MHDGSVFWTPAGLIHVVTLLESHPQPRPGVTPLAGCGLSPVNPSSVPATAYRWPPHEGESAIENVSSEMANWPTEPGQVEYLRGLVAADALVARRRVATAVLDVLPAVHPPAVHGGNLGGDRVVDRGDPILATDGVTTAPLDRVTDEGMPPSGQRPGL